MATSITNALRDALRDTLKNNLNAKLQAVGARAVREINRFKRATFAAELLPLVMVEAQSFRQNVGDFSAGSTSLGERIYNFYVWACVTGANEEEAEERIAAYVDAIDATLSGSTLGLTAVMDTWVGVAEISAATPAASDQLKSARLTVSVKVYMQTGNTSL